MKKSHGLFAALIASCLLAACTKKIDNSVHGRVVGEWKLVKSGYDDNGNGIVDASELADWATDNPYYITFITSDKGHDLFLESGEQKADNFNWYLKNNDADILLTFTTGAYSTQQYLSRIVSLTSDEFISRDTVKDASGLRYYWSKYKKQ